MTVVGYTRVSLDEQGERGIGLAAQRAAITAEAEARGWEIVEFVEDSGYSGRDFNRPGISQVLKLLRTKKADALLVAKLDRLSRSLLDFAGVMEQAQREQWGVVALDLNVDTTTASGALMAHVMASFAQYERRLIAQRTSDALKELRSQGRAFGPTPFGFKREGDLLVECADEQRVVTRMMRLRSKGHSYDRIAKALNRSGIPAKRGGSWFAASVRSVVKTAPSVGCAGVD
jgi:DNA invertase Pin-like site-specific DNA recombinase